MLALILLLALPIGAATLLSVAMANATETDLRQRWRGRLILGIGATILLLALVLAATCALLIVTEVGINRSSEELVLACFVGTVLFGPVGVLLVLLARSLRSDQPCGRRLTPSLLRTILTIYGYILCSLPPALLFPPLVGLVVAASFAALGFFRQRREGQLLWVLRMAVERQMPVPEELAANAEAMGGRTGLQLQRCSDAMAAGMSLSDALVLPPSVLPPPPSLAVRIGEQTGRLGPVLRDAADRVAGSAAQTAQASYVVGAITYLWIVLLVIIGVLGFVMYYIIPKFKAIFEDFDAELPATTVALIKTSDFWVDWWFLMLPGLLGLVALCVAAGECCRRGWRNLSLPRLTRWFPRLDSPDILRNLSRAVESQTPLPAVLQTLADHHHRPHIADRLQTVTSRVEQGDDPWRSLSGVGLLTTDESDLLTSAAAVGNLDWALVDLADRLDRRSAQRWRWWFEVLRPWPVLLLGGLAAFFAIGMFLPLVKLILELS